MWIMNIVFFFWRLRDRKHSYPTNGIFGRDLYEQKEMDDRENFEGKI